MRRYSQAGVRSSDEIGGFGEMLELFRRTFAYPSHGRPTEDFGLYANILDLGNNLGLAISTDGVGTKILVAEAMGKYDTIGIDCVAMNANDIVCVGAEPIAMVDYVAVQRADKEQLLAIARGIEEGARQARISIPGGEIAQVPEMLSGERPGEGIDLVGTCVGTVALDRVVTGAAVEAGDVLVGFASSGIHSNGLTLARRALVDEAGWGYDRYVEDFGRTLGEELLEPTRMYVDLAMSLLRGMEVRGLAHVTGEGFLNLQRMKAPVGFEIEVVPERPAVFGLIQRIGAVDAAEMFRVYNMGVGFFAVVPEADGAAAVGLAKRLGIEAWVLGHATTDESRTIRIRPEGLTGAAGRFVED
ncbi:MAG: phosphoribosylformylglycinamidine cyclo-ligase [Dehalococcoidia bacterium]